VRWWRNPALTDHGHHRAADTGVPPMNVEDMALQGAAHLPLDSQVAFYLEKARHYQGLAQLARTDGVRQALEAVARAYVHRASAAKPTQD
jgi:hypothetical protein